MSRVIAQLIYLQMQVRIFHWQTKSYARHKALGKFYESFDDLWLYCYRVASVVGLISMQIIGYVDEAVDYAVKLGVALDDEGDGISD